MNDPLLGEYRDTPLQSPFPRGAFMPDDAPFPRTDTVVTEREAEHPTPPAQDKTTGVATLSCGGTLLITLPTPRIRYLLDP